MSISTKIIIKRETRISVIINMLLSAAFFFVVFGVSPQILATAAPDALALDFIPQSLAVGFFASLVPALIISGRRQKGRIDGVDSNAVPAPTTLLRAFGFALATGMTGALIAVALPLIVTEIGYFSALAMKLVYAAVLAVLVTPHALRLALASSTNH